MRLTAVLLVLGRHMLPLPSENDSLALWRRGGWVGVDLFFVLSGFLISGLLFDEYAKTNHIDIRRFYVRRFFKIYPPLVALIAATVGVRYALGSPPSPRQTISELLLCQNYAGSLWNHTWSLALECHFYVFLGLLANRLVHREPRTDNPFRIFVILFPAVAIGCLAARIITSSIFDGFNYKWFLFGTHVRLDSLMCGVALRYLSHFHGLQQVASRVPWWALAASAAALMSPAFLFELEDHKSVSVFGPVAFYLSSSLLVLLATRVDSTPHLALKSLASLGAISYSVYLWHMPVNAWLWPTACKLAGANHESNPCLYLTFYITCSFVTGYILNRVIEAPSQYCRDALFPSSPSRHH